jgi:tetratricopeptide (TPR) repeat protein
VTTPRFPDFIVPEVPAAFATTTAAVGQARGWAFLQSGDVKNADRELSAALKSTPSFYPAEVSLGYVELARQRGEPALAHFDRALEQHAGDVAALVGKGQALLALDREADALVAFEGAIAANPLLTDIARRVDVLRFRTQQANLGRARQFARSGRLDGAVLAYTSAIAASPDSPFLYREIAEVERQIGDTNQALQHFLRAVALDPGDARSLTQVGEILEGRNDGEGAIKAYTAALAIEPNAGTTERLEGLRTRAALARLPDEYRAIDQTSQITRGEVAALIGVRLAPLLQATATREAEPITDVRTDWASAWIVAVTRVGVMAPFANHAFQPRMIVRRTDFAEVVSRLLARIVMRNPNLAKSWESARLTFPDLAPSHLAYVAASQAVASGVMKTGPDTSFQPTRAVGGAEAVEAIDRLQTLAGIQMAGRGAR